MIASMDCVGLRSRLASLIGVLAVLLAMPQLASAITIDPPGKAGANQYAETIPTANGNTTPPAGGGSSAPVGGALAQLGRGRAGASALVRRGGDGRAAAAFATATAPAVATSPLEPGAPSGVATPHGDSPLSTILGSLTGSDNGGLGALLPVLLAVTLVLAVGLAVWRRRQRTEPPGLGG